MALEESPRRGVPWLSRGLGEDPRATRLMRHRWPGHAAVSRSCWSQQVRSVHPRRTPGICLRKRGATGRGIRVKTHHFMAILWETQGLRAEKKARKQTAGELGFFSPLVFPFAFQYQSQRSLNSVLPFSLDVGEEGEAGVGMTGGRETSWNRPPS